MNFSVALATLFAVILSASAAPTTTVQPKGLFKIAPGAPDGLYTHHVALDGSVHTLYHGEWNRTTSAATATTSAAKSKRSPFGVYCQTLTFQPADGQQAVLGLANTLNANNQFYHSISYSSGTAVAYGCDYGHGQTMSGADTSDYLAMVENQCGNNKQGWFSLPDWKASYGMTVSGSSFC